MVRGRLHEVFCHARFCILLEMHRDPPPLPHPPPPSPTVPTSRRLTVQSLHVAKQFRRNWSVHRERALTPSRASC